MKNPGKGRSRPRALKALSLGVLCLAALIAGCTRPASQGPMVVAATIPPVAEFVEKVGGDRVRVAVMVPPGASPHTYEPRPSQLEQLSRARVYAKVGSGIDFELAWMDRLEKINKDMLVVDCSQGIALIGSDEEDHEEERDKGHDDAEAEEGHHHHHHGKDPHIWLSPANAIAMVSNIRDGLVAADPEGRDYYTKNADAYIGELKALDFHIRKTLDAMEGTGGKGRKFMVYHPAWAYFARDYGLIEVPVEREGKEPTARSMAGLVSEARAEGIKVVFASPEFSSRSVETIASELGARVVEVSSLEKDYITNMKKAAEAFSKR